MYLMIIRLGLSLIQLYGLVHSVIRGLRLCPSSCIYTFMSLYKVRVSHLSPFASINSKIETLAMIRSFCHTGGDLLLRECMHSTSGYVVGSLSPVARVGVPQPLEWPIFDLSASFAVWSSFLHGSQGICTLITLRPLAIPLAITEAEVQTQDLVPAL